MKSNSTSNQRLGFTLVELLVVIAIIGILTAILIPTLQIAIKTTREAAVKFELTQMAMAIEEYKNQSGLVYPPDFTSPSRAQALLAAHVKKLSRNNNENIVNLLTTDLDGAGPLLTIDTNADLTDGLQSRITPDEALVFWLAGTKKNAELPLTGTGERREFFAFKQDRLVDFDGDGFFSYVPRYGARVPYLYFDSRTYADNDGAMTPVYSAVFDPSANSVPDPKGVARPYTMTAGGFADPNKFQILSAGYDGDYGANLINKQFPGGANFSLGDRDNFASFAEGRMDKDLDN